MQKHLLIVEDDDSPDPFLPGNCKVRSSGGCTWTNVREEALELLRHIKSYTLNVIFPDQFIKADNVKSVYYELTSKMLSEIPGRYLQGLTDIYYTITIKKFLSIYKECLLSLREGRRG